MSKASQIKVFEYGEKIFLILDICIVRCFIYISTNAKLCLKTTRKLRSSHFRGGSVVTQARGLGFGMVSESVTTNQKAIPFLRNSNSGGILG